MTCLETALFKMRFKSILYLTPLILSLSIGCASIKNRFPTDNLFGKKEPLSKPVVNLENAKDLSFLQVKESIISEGMKFKGLKAKVDITIESPEINGAFKCKGNLVLQKPDKIRVIGSKLARTVFDMISDGDNFWVYLPKDRTVYSGKCNTVRNPDNKVYIFPNDIAELLNYDKALEGKYAFMETWPAFWFVHVLDKKEEEFVPYSRLKIDRVESRVTELVLFNEESTIKAYATFDDYSIIDNHVIPKAVQINWPGTKTTIKIIFKDISLNDNLKPEIFQFKKPKNAEIVKLN